MSRGAEAIMTASTCVHCGADSQPAATGGYCVSCGRHQVEPATGKHDEADRESAGIPSEAQKRTARVASLTLLGVALLYLVFGLASATLVGQIDLARGGAGRTFQQLAVLGGFVAVFSVLGLWARRRPLYASLVGSILYAGIMVIQIVTGASPVVVAVMAVVLAALAWPVGLALTHRDKKA